jgi:hypothetical protein
MEKDISAELAAAARQLKLELLAVQNGVVRHEKDQREAPMSALLEKTLAALTHERLSVLVLYTGDRCLDRFLGRLHPAFGDSRNSLLPRNGDFIHIAHGDANGGGEGEFLLKGEPESRSFSSWEALLAHCNQNSARGNPSIQFPFAPGRNCEFFIPADIANLASRPALGSFFYTRVNCVLLLFDPALDGEERFPACDEAASIYQFIQFMAFADSQAEPAGEETEAFIRGHFPRSGGIRREVYTGGGLPDFLVRENYPPRQAVNLIRLSEHASRELKLVMENVNAELKDYEGRNSAYTMEMGKSHHREVFEGVRTALTELKEKIKSQQENFDQMLRTDQTKKMREFSNLSNLAADDIVFFKDYKNALDGITGDQFSMEAQGPKINIVRFSRDFSQKTADTLLNMIHEQYHQYRQYAAETIAAVREEAEQFSAHYFNDPFWLHVEEISLDGYKSEFRSADLILKYSLSIPNSKNPVVIFTQARTLIMQVIGVVMMGTMAGLIQREYMAKIYLAAIILIVVLAAVYFIRARDIDRRKIEADLPKARETLAADVSRMLQDVYRGMGEYLSREMKAWIAGLYKKMDAALVQYQELLSGESQDEKETLKRKMALNERRIRELQGLVKTLDTGSKNIERLIQDIERLTRSIA